MTATESRAERKERTRAALLDGALGLLADRSLSALSLREVARSAGIVPTAFYRHFASMDELGVALVEDGMRMLRRMLREARRDPAPRDARTSLDILVRQVRANEGQFRFLSRERYGGVTEVRQAIASELRLFSSELSTDLGRNPALAGWPRSDLDMAADLIVGVMMTTVIDLLEVTGAGEEDVIGRAERQLRLIIIGMGGWRPAAS
ncbi:TetR family transcriptional regulator [Rhodococcus sp. RD6.2]|uniref:TetR family transcriptional regulator n=1 Tax=Rhodococcus sp. RD6.2 TaxID=260936 RepID=UPI000679A612|nr:TetR family transcriptional regulator [Rhodococcus sp. RD6.2]